MKQNKMPETPGEIFATGEGLNKLKPVEISDTRQAFAHYTNAFFFKITDVLRTEKQVIEFLNFQFDHATAHGCGIPFLRMVAYNSANSYAPLMYSELLQNPGISRAQKINLQKKLQNIRIAQRWGENTLNDLNEKNA